jgi:CDP-diacylglycerol---glycerol-3-phosphate 3-phosphatidyltransferase
VINVANVLTVARVVLALGTVSLLFVASDQARWIAFVLTIFVIWADGLDGYFARKLKQTSKLGGVLDIAGDRAVELVYWIVFAVLGWIPVWIPILFVVRGTFVDAMRSHAAEDGFTAFGVNTMMHSKVGKFLVASNFSRFSYAIAKAVAFCLMIAANTAAGRETVVPSIAIFCVYFSAVFCVVRGLPVFFEGDNIFIYKPAANSPKVSQSLEEVTPHEEVSKNE